MIPPKNNNTKPFNFIFSYSSGVISNTDHPTRRWIITDVNWTLSRTIQLSIMPIIVKNNNIKKYIVPILGSNVIKHIGINVASSNM